MENKKTLKEIFEKLPWIKIAQFAKVIQMDKDNLNKYIQGKLSVSEDNYTKIITGLKALKNNLP